MVIDNDEIVAPFGAAHTYIAQTGGVPPPPWESDTR